MPKPWEPGGGEADWAGVVPQELEFWLADDGVHVRPAANTSWSDVIPDGWVQRYLPPWLWVQPRPAVFLPPVTQDGHRVVEVMRAIGFWHAMYLDSDSPLSSAAVDTVTGYRLPSEVDPSLGERVAREIEAGPFEGHLSFDVHVTSVPEVESRGYAPHIEFRLRSSPVVDPGSMRKVAGPPLADRIVALFNNDLSVVHTAVVLQNRLGANTPVKTTILQETLLELVMAGRLYFLHNQESEGYRLVRREGVEAPSVWERLVKGDSDL